MAMTFAKRNKEKLRQEKQRDKAIKRQQRKLERENRPPASDDDSEDPDLAGIVAGPQPIVEEP